MKILFFLLFGFLLASPGVLALPYSFSPAQLQTPPPRIIRTCCILGTGLQIWGIPGLSITEVSCITSLGPHHFLGNQREGDGIIYTRLGGFIDMAHVRDQADWTAWLYSRILEAGGQRQDLDLGYEGGDKTLVLPENTSADPMDACQLAGRIAYDLSVWHEIASWFGASAFPLLPEGYSSFSVEDIYSNLLGVSLGIKALQSSLPYETAMTALIRETLDRLGAVETEAETLQALEDVRNLWWTADKKLPGRKVLLVRELKPYPEVFPWLVPEWNPCRERGTELKVPVCSPSGYPWSSRYKLTIRLNGRFPVHSLFPGNTGRTVTQDDFGTLIRQINDESGNRSNP
jgi:hypothetical protein